MTIAYPTTRSLAGRILLTLWLAVAAAGTTRAELPQLQLPDPGLQPEQLAIIVNREDPLSVRIGNYYRQRHGIPSPNLVEVSFDPGRPQLHPGDFAVLQKVVEASVPETVQAYLLTWAEPYRVGCMSITSAFALGYDRKYCAEGCRQTAINPWAGSRSLTPWDDFGIRPSMLLAATSFEEARDLVDRGVESRGWYFRESGTVPAAYLVETSDKNRSVRKAFFPAARHRFNEMIRVNVLQTDAVEDARDIMFYFTGARYVEGLDSNHYLPGAIADHLTSTGGKLTGSGQMSAIEWLRAGATGSYGTVVEPCNFTAKFPNPPRVMELYLAGRTLLEAYWKSVLTPGQGVFIGDPLAAPFRGYRMEQDAGGITVHTAQLLPGRYRLLAADSSAGPFSPLPGELEIGAGWQSFRLPVPVRGAYRLQRID